MTITITGTGVTPARSSTFSATGVTALNLETIGTSAGDPGILIAGIDANVTNSGAILAGTRAAAQGRVPVTGSGAEGPSFLLSSAPSGDALITEAST
jgi:hypothetical protein